MTWQLEILLAAFLAALIELVEHWFPWRMAIKRDLPRPVAYTFGVFGFMLPYLGLLWHWYAQMSSDYPLPCAFLPAPHLIVQRAFIAILAVIGSAGAAVWGAYLVDYIISRIRLADELLEIQHHADRSTDG